MLVFNAILTQSIIVCDIYQGVLLSYVNEYVHVNLLTQWLPTAL